MCNGFLKAVVQSFAKLNATHLLHAPTLRIFYLHMPDLPLHEQPPAAVRALISPLVFDFSPC
jgi:hypothetical protein